MSEHLIGHIRNCSRCHILLKHPANSALHLLAHLVEHRFSQADALKAVKFIYSKIDQLRRTEARS